MLGRKLPMDKFQRFSPAINTDEVNVSFLSFVPGSMVPPLSALFRHVEGAQVQWLWENRHVLVNCDVIPTHKEINREARPNKCRLKLNSPTTFECGFDRFID